MCFDPLGTFTLAFITDVRPTLFDGQWKSNVGGADFLQMFGRDGRLRYLRPLDPQLHSSGPCLSDAEHSAETVDGTVSQHLRIRGGRTDDFVRVFMDVRVDVRQDTDIFRLFFFQISSETYFHNAQYERIVWGSTTSEDIVRLEQACTVPGKTSEDLYSQSLPLRETLSGTAPWCFAFENSSGGTPTETDIKVVG